MLGLLILLVLPLFFTYIFPFFFVNVPYQPLAPPFALWCFILGVGLWTLFNFLVFKGMIYNPWQQLANAKKALREGEVISGEIEGSRLLEMSGDMKKYALTVHFKNYSHTDLYLNYQISDSKPQEGRFAEGETFAFVLNESKNGPLLYPIVATYTLGGMFYTGIAFIVINLVYMVMTFLYYQQLHGTGVGLDIYFLVPSHPWIMSAVLGIFMSIVVMKLGRYEREKQWGTVRNINQLIARGIIAEGEITNVKETGNAINDTPQVAFTVQYTDQQGKKHVAGIMKYVSLLNLAKAQKGTKEILYLPEQPQAILFTEDLLDED